MEDQLGFARARTGCSWALRSKAGVESKSRSSTVLDGVSRRTQVGKITLEEVKVGRGQDGRSVADQVTSKGLARSGVRKVEKVERGFDQCSRAVHLSVTGSVQLRA